MPVSASEKLLVEFLSPEEMDAMIEDWDRYDTDQSGVVTKDEFIQGEKKWYQRVYGQEISAEDLEDKLQFWKRTRDTDGSGEVSWTEFSESKSLLILDQRNALRDCLTDQEVEEARATFNAIDADLSGAITQTEAREFFKKRADVDVKNNLRTARNAIQHVDKQVANLFNQKDEDGSGTVDFDEFLREEAKNIIGDRHLEDENKQSLVTNAALACTGGQDGDGPVVHEILTEEQKEHAKILFAQWDKDGSGTLELNELTKKEVCESLKIPKTKPKEIKKIIKNVFSKIDSDSNGTLSFDEFLSLYNFLFLQEANMDMIL